MTAYIALAISAMGFVASVYYSNKSAKRQDEQSSKEDIEDIKEEVKRNTEINFKLDQLLSSVNNTSREISEIKKDLSKLSTDYITIAKDVKSLTDRVDKSETQLAKLHQEVRTYVESIAAAEAAHEHEKE